ncbi:L,D-transpeptidase [Actinophytocola oryzae]|uniref:Lipoprotein-anchoring transpeptidase ErfK/SrfK n=1 Tax=Actinophytocola oryzae TaxID=502181 RepID=A0A4R7VDJ7_9PSEU|nr:L,D-transpeptidase [Actinophytocola oryzae]TDV47059.1 lipoprotein-anchoring transpeptidase ErfK/SrfK [Actinophytocola oryzae]
MRRTLLLGFAAIAVLSVSACGGTDTAAPGPDRPTAPTTTTSTTQNAAPQPAEDVKLPPLPEVKAANETITKTTPPPPPPPTGVPCGAGVDACVDLSSKQTWLIKDGAVVYGPAPITSGRAGYRTPPGTFSVGWKDIDHKSSEFNDAPMPFSVFFNGGIAFHQGSLSAESHGCIHLSRAAAEAYYNALAVGDKVQVVA